MKRSYSLSNTVIHIWIDALSLHILVVVILSRVLTAEHPNRVIHRTALESGIYCCVFWHFQEVALVGPM
jgi:hypothetical protein